MSTVGMAQNPDSVAPGRASARPPAATAARALLGLVLLAGAAASVAKWVLDIPYPFALDYGEGIVLDRTIALARGEPLYTAMDRPPFVTWNFPPVYAWLCGIAAAQLGASWAIGRCLSVCAALAAAACIYLLARRESGSRAWGLAAALLFAGSRPVGDWGALMRVDMLGLASGLCGLAALAAGLPAALAGMLFAVGILCKQSLVAALAAALLYLAVERRGRDLARLAGTCAVVVAGVLAWQAMATDGLLWRHLFTSNMNRWGPELLWRLLREFLGRHGLLVALAAAGWVLRPTGGPSLARCYLVTASLSVLLAGKLGASNNYFLELTAALATAAAAGAGAALRALQLRLPGGLPEAALAVVLAAHVARAAQVPKLGERPRTPYLRAASPLLARSRQPVISDDPGLVVACGHRLWLQPFEFTQMAEAGVWNQAPVLDALRRGEIGAVAIHFNPWDRHLRDRSGTWESGTFTDEMVSAIRAHYRPAYRCGPMWVLLPQE